MNIGKYERFKNEWINLYKSGMSLIKIGAQYNVSKGTVKSEIKNDVQLRAHVGKYDEYVAVWMTEYIAGASIQQIAKKFKVPPSTVKMNLLKNGIEIRSNKPSIYLIHQKEWVKMYINGESLMEIGEKFGVAADTVKALILPYIDTRNYIESSNSTALNEDYFKLIDTEEKAYWLGFCFASGYISRKRVNDDELKVAFIFRENELHLSKAFKLALDTNKTVNFDKNDNLGRLEFINRDFIDTLIAAGMQPNNKKGSDFPEIAHHLQIPFLIGYFEKRIYMNHSKIYVGAVVKVAEGINEVLQRFGINGEIRIKESEKYSQWVTMTPDDSRLFIKVVEPFEHLIISKRLLKVLATPINDSNGSKL